MLRLGVAFNAVELEAASLLFAFDLDKGLVERDSSGKPKGFIESWFSSWNNGFGIGPEWAWLNFVHRSFPTAAGDEKWVVDLVVSR